MAPGAFKTLRDSPAIVILAFPNRDNVKVSEDAANYGLNVLRAKPSQIPVTVVPDVIQVRYSVFKDLLSQFSYSSLKDVDIPSRTDQVAISFRDLIFDKGQGEILHIGPFDTPPVVMSWLGKELPRETVEQIRNHLDVKEGVSGGNPAILFKPANWIDYDKVKGYKANPRATCPIETVNLKCVTASRAILAIFTSIILAIRYPAFVDTETATDFLKLQDYLDDDEMEVDDGAGTSKKTKAKDIPTVDAPAKFKSVDQSNVPVQQISYKNLPEGRTFIHIDDLTNVPPGDGLWFPYFSFTADYDISTVPNFLRRYVPMSFGNGIDDALDTLRECTAEFGTFGRTEGGKELTHAVAVTDMAIQGQARPIPCFRGGRYAGSIILGAGFTIELNKVLYRPVTHDELVEAIKDSDIHAQSLLAISKLVGNKTQVNDILGSETMLDLWKHIRSAWTKSKDEDSLLKLAASLDFGEKSWQVNSTQLKLAFDSISDPNFTLTTAKGVNFPIHHSQLLSNDTTALVWSCFGSMAPSFLVPGGRTFALDEDMEVEVKNPGGRSISKKIVRISVRSKVLEQAIADLKEVMNEKHIQNPLVAAKVRASQMYMDKMFSDKAGKELLGMLREFVGISKSGKGKKRGADNDHPEAGSSKRHKAGILDDDEW